MHLRLVGHQLGKEPGEADRFGAQLVPHEVLAAGRGVALVEDQVDDREHGAEPVR